MTELSPTLEDLVTTIKLIEELAENTSHNTISFSEENMALGTILLDKAASLANDLLITHNGQPNWNNMKAIAKSYSCEPLENDKFGWLVAGIQTSKGIIMYG